MNPALPVPKSPKLKPPPLPKACGLSVVPPPESSSGSRDSEEVTAVGDAPPEVLATARSDLRELRPSRPTPPRPTRPPPLPTAVRPAAGPDTARPQPPVASTPAPAATSTPQPVAALRPEAATEPEPEPSAAMKPRPFVLARTAWFFGVFVATGVFRWTVARFSRGGAWLAAEWRHAAIRANPPR